MNKKAATVVLLFVITILAAVTHASMLSISQKSSGLMSSAQLTHSQSEVQLMANQTYWTYRGDAPAEGAPYVFNQNSNGLQIGVQAPSMGTYAGYFAMSPATSGYLFHATITTPDRTISSGAFESSIYAQTADGNLDYVACGSYTTSSGTDWEIVYATGNAQQTTGYKVLWVDTAPNQPLTENCTMVTNGKNYLEVYLNSTLVYSNSSMSLNIPSPFFYFLEPETSYSGSMLYGTFKNYYVTSGETLQLTNIPSSASKVELVNSAGSVVASAPVKSGAASIEIAQFSFPLSVSIEVYDANGNEIASTPSTVGVYGGDVYAVGNAQLSPPPQSSSSVTVNSINQAGTQINGYYTVLSQGSQTLGTGFTSATFQTTAGESYNITLSSYASCTFSHWQGSTSSSATMNFVASGSEGFTGVYNCNGVSSTTTTTTTTTTSTSSTTTISGSSTSSVTVNSINEQGVVIPGYYTTLSTGGKIINSGFTSATFQTTTGTSYTLGVDNYGSCNFAYWQDTKSTSAQRTFTAQGSQAFVAVYNCV